MQALCQEEVQPLTETAGGGQGHAHGQEGVRHGTGLLLQLPQGTGHRVLARLQLSGGDLQQRLSDHIAVLGDGEHIVPVVQGQNGHAVHMLYYLAERGPAVRQLHLVHVQAQEASLVLFLPAEGLLRQIRSLIHIAFHLVSIFCIFRTYSITLL